jgi:hypothetical protein
MQIILSFILSILILIFFIYHFKNNKEGLTITGDMQPDLKYEIYDYNLRQAQSIWKDVGCTNGSYKPTEGNKGLWKHEKWREELKAYKTEADLNEKENNYYDFIGKEIDGVTQLKYGLQNAVGIGEAYNRCYDEKFKTTYTFPKAGDRIKIKENTKGTATDYYSGIVLEGDDRKATPLEVLWDSKGKEGTMEKDTKRTETKTEKVQTNNIKIKEDSLEFGWPYQEWNRHPAPDRKEDSIVSEKDWIKMNDMGKVDPKIVYKSTNCDTDSKCDNLNCDKRTDEILNRYPITYYCKSDPKNSEPSWICKSGEKKGMITKYYDDDSMCFRDETGNEYGRKFALQECGGENNLKQYTDTITPENIVGGDCYAFISDKINGKGNRAVIGDKQEYNINHLTKLGLTNGKIMSAQLYGDEFCIAKFDERDPVVKSSGDIAPPSGATKIVLRKQERGCEVVIDNKAVANNIFKDTEKTDPGVLKGTPYNSNKMVEKGIPDNSTKKFTLKGVGGYDNKNCRVAFYPGEKATPEMVPLPNMPEIFKGDELPQTVEMHSGQVSSMSIFKVPSPVLEPGNYKIKSRRTDKYCFTYEEKDILGRDTGKKFLQCDNKGNGTKKGDKFTLALINDMDPNGYYISQEKQRCKFQKIGLGYNIKCDNDGEDRSLNSQFELSKIGDYHKIKNKKTRRHCTNRRDILMPGGGIIACNGMGNRQWQDYKFEKIL